MSVHDIPVFDGYIIDLLDTGVKLRRTSKWLNAVSVSLPVADIGNKLQQLEALPYVQSIDVVATFVRAQDHAHTTMEAREYHTTQEYEDDIIDLYGSSYTQLSQINVTAAHALGYNGTGVIIMVADTGFLKTHPAFSMTRFDYIIYLSYLTCSGFLMNMILLKMIVIPPQIVDMRHMAQLRFQILGGGLQVN